jgi:hypothetical protein
VLPTSTTNGHKDFVYVRLARYACISYFFIMEKGI